MTRRKYLNRNAAIYEARMGRYSWPEIARDFHICASRAREVFIRQRQLRCAADPSMTAPDAASDTHLWVLFELNRLAEIRRRAIR